MEKNIKLRESQLNIKEEDSSNIEYSNNCSFLSNKSDTNKNNTFKKEKEKEKKKRPSQDIQFTDDFIQEQKDYRKYSNKIEEESIRDEATSSIALDTKSWRESYIDRSNICNIENNDCNDYSNFKSNFDKSVVLQNNNNKSGSFISDRSFQNKNDLNSENNHYENLPTKESKETKTSKITFKPNKKEKKINYDNIIFSDKISKTIIMEMKLHFKLLLPSRFPDSIYSKILSNELTGIVGYDKTTEESLCFAILEPSKNNIMYNLQLNTKNENDLRDLGYLTTDINNKENDKIKQNLNKNQNTTPNNEQASSPEKNKIQNKKVNYCCIREQSNKPKKQKLTILAFAVIKEHQRKGVGGKLMDKILTLSKDSNHDLVELIVQNINIPAIGFYQKQGFRTKRILEDYYKFSEEDSNKALLMRKHINTKYHNETSLNERSGILGFFEKLKNIIFCGTGIRPRSSSNRENTNNSTTSYENNKYNNYKEKINRNEVFQEDEKSFNTEERESEFEESDFYGSDNDDD